MSEKARDKLDKYAKGNIKTLRYWFRDKFNLPPTDPRYLAMDDISLYTEFRLDQEMQQFEKEEEERMRKLRESGADPDSEGSYVETINHGNGESTTVVQAKTDYTPEDMEKIYVEMDETGKSFNEVMKEYGRKDS